VFSFLNSCVLVYQLCEQTLLTVDLNFVVFFTVLRPENITCGKYDQLRVFLFFGMFVHSQRVLEGRQNLW